MTVMKPCVVCGARSRLEIWGYPVCPEHAAAWNDMPPPEEHKTASGPELAAAWKRDTRAWLGKIYLELKATTAPKEATP